MAKPKECFGYGYCCIKIQYTLAILERFNFEMLYPGHATA
jgi:hypothetical protein